MSSAPVATTTTTTTAAAVSLPALEKVEADTQVKKDEKKKEKKGRKGGGVGKSTDSKKKQKHTLSADAIIVSNKEKITAPVMKRFIKEATKFEDPVLHAALEKQRLEKKVVLDAQNAFAHLVKSLVITMARHAQSNDRHTVNTYDLMASARHFVPGVPFLSKSSETAEPLTPAFVQFCGEIESENSIIPDQIRHLYPAKTQKTAENGAAVTTSKRGGGKKKKAVTANDALAAEAAPAIPVSA